MLSTRSHDWAGLRFFFHIPCQHDQTFWILNIGFPSLWKKNNLRTRELVQCLITHTTLPEDPSSIPSTHSRKNPPLPTRPRFSFTQWSSRGNLWSLCPSSRSLHLQPGWKWERYSFFMQQAKEHILPPLVLITVSQCISQYRQENWQTTAMGQIRVLLACARPEGFERSVCFK